MHRGARYIYIYIHRLTDYVQTVLHLFELSPSAQLRSRPFIILRTPPLAIVLLKLRYIQGVRLKSDVMRKLSESSRGGHGYGRRNSFLFRGERTNERPCSWKRTKFFITVGKRGGHAEERERQRKSHVRYRTRPCLLNFKSRQSNYGGCSLNRAICSSRLNPHC